MYSYVALIKKEEDEVLYAIAEELGKTLFHKKGFFS